MENNYIALKKSVISIIILLILIAAYSGFLDQAGENYTDAALKRALVTFGIARGINGVISVAQGTEVALHPAGFGVNFTPGQILDPVNDMIEQFSWVMLASSASLGIQKILLTISSSTIITIFLTLALVVLLFFQWKASSLNESSRKVLLTLVIVLLFARFSVPLTAVAGEGLYNFYLEDQYEESTQRLELAQQAISDISSAETENIELESKEGLIEKARKFFDTASQGFSLDERFNQYKESAALATEHAIHLIVVFLIQTVFFPLLFLWFVYRGLKLVWKNGLSIL